MGTRKVSITAGFITNSSSVVYHFPKQLWEHPSIKALAEAYGISERGYVGREVWSRGSCETVAVTRAEKKELHEAFGEDYDYGSPPMVDIEHDGPIIVYGDEYEGLAQSIITLARSLVREDSNLPDFDSEDYN